RPPSWALATAGATAAIPRASVAMARRWGASRPGARRVWVVMTDAPPHRSLGRKTPEGAVGFALQVEGAGIVSLATAEFAAAELRPTPDLALSDSAQADLAPPVTSISRPTERPP